MTFDIDWLILHWEYGHGGSQIPNAISWLRSDDRLAMACKGTYGTYLWGNSFIEALLINSGQTNIAELGDARQTELLQRAWCLVEQCTQSP